MEKTAVEWLAEKYNYVTWMSNRDEISAGMADEWRKHYLEQAKEMHNKQLREVWNDGYKKAQQDIGTNSFSTFEQYQNEKNG